MWRLCSTSYSASGFCKGIEKWEVNIENPDKVLTVITDGTKANQIQEAVTKAGFKAEKV